MSSEDNHTLTLEDRINAMDLVIRHMFEVMTPTKIQKFSTIINLTLNKLRKDENSDPEKIKWLEMALKHMGVYIKS
ncbi:hypothetical protein EDI85_21320 [Salmonella enterica]|nr:hypothetical protein [Salmonella enterica subsp. diarizonae]ECJ5865356.1 hypothetical protein [Salmonella enterica subsp. diarizonae]EEB6126580.1 hypothetical protein [Salmonella enterica subsp. diarizonae]MEI37369.1 hypothetical protein [Salmonella enterica]